MWGTPTVIADNKCWSLLSEQDHWPGTEAGDGGCVGESGRWARAVLPSSPLVLTSDWGRPAEERRQEQRPEGTEALREGEVRTALGSGMDPWGPSSASKGSAGALSESLGTSP